MKAPKILYLCNAFSLQMLDLDYRNEISTVPVYVEKRNGQWIANINGEDLPLTSIESSIGHQPMADYLGVKMNRSNTHLNVGDSILVAQYVGGRLPEGVTTLPENAEIKFTLITIQSSIDVTSFFKFKEELIINIGCSVTYGDMEIYSSVKSACMSILCALEKSPSATIEALKEFLGVKDE